MKKDVSTEQKIKDAARKVFMSKGFSGCTTREIAKSVGIPQTDIDAIFNGKWYTPQKLPRLKALIKERADSKST